MNIIIELSADPSEVDKYGIEGLRQLWVDILERYANEEHYDPDLLDQILKEKEE